MPRGPRGPRHNSEAYTYDMIAAHRHTEVREGQPPHFIVKMPNEHFEGERMGVRFRHGQARTGNPEKAKRFDEEFGYKVWLPEGYEGWSLGTSPSLIHPDYSEPETIVLDDVELDDAYSYVDHRDDDDELPPEPGDPMPSRARQRRR